MYLNNQFTFFSLCFRDQGFIQRERERERKMSSQSDEELRKCLKPNPTNDQVVTAIKNTYKTSNVSILTELESYDDRNYLVLVDDEKFLAKIYNGVESSKYIASSSGSISDENDEDGSRRLSSIHLYSILFEHLNQPKYGVRTSSPHPIPGLINKPYVSVHDFPVTSKRYRSKLLVLQLLTWVDGKSMSYCPLLPIETLADAGRYLGKVCQALDDLTNTNTLAKKAADRYHAWDGKNTMDLAKFTYCITNDRRGSLVKEVLSSFQKDLLDSGDVPLFRTGILQGDFNDANIIVDDEKKVSGVIDFGDTTLR